MQPFWQFITIVEQEMLIEERQIAINDADEPQTQEHTKVEKRIKERLYMFFGLLKRSFEDTSYNSNFHYSDFKLAFMTLWSCLNDIQYIYYDKSETWTNNNGKEFFNIKIEEYLTNKLSVSISDDLERYLQRKKSGANKFESLLKVDYSITTPYILNVNPVNINRFTDSIGEQIGFLILTFNKGTITDNTASRYTTQTLVNNLVQLKDKRNKLYLTHGNEEKGSTFFVNTEKDNPDITLKDCTQLFEIIYFLLTGTLEKIEV